MSSEVSSVARERKLLQTQAKVSVRLRDNWRFSNDGDVGIAPGPLSEAALQAAGCRLQAYSIQ